MTIVVNKNFLTFSNLLDSSSDAMEYMVSMEYTDYPGVGMGLRTRKYSDISDGRMMVGFSL